MRCAHCQNARPPQQYTCDRHDQWKQQYTCDRHDQWGGVTITKFTCTFSVVVCAANSELPFLAKPFFQLVAVRTTLREQLLQDLDQAVHLCHSPNGDTKADNTIGVLLGPHQDVSSANLCFPMKRLLKIAEDVVRTAGPKNNAMTPQEVLKLWLGTMIQLIN